MPQSYFHIIFDKSYAFITSKFYTAPDESANINAKVKMSENPDIDINCKAPKINLSNLKRITVSVCDLLKMPTNLREFKISGVLNADFNVQTNMKTFRSNGNLKISNAAIEHKSIPLKINGINADVDFSNNNLKILKSNLFVNSQPVKVQGSINQNAVGDIVISSSNLDLNHILNAFPVFKIQKT